MVTKLLAPLLEIPAHLPVKWPTNCALQVFLRAKRLKKKFITNFTQKIYYDLH